MASTALAGFEETAFTHDGVTKPVFRAGSGPGVVVVHEIPGITPLVADFGRRLVSAGFTVAMPSLAGDPGRAMSGGYVMTTFTKVCISKEFSTWALNRTSPVITWLRALARDLHATAGGPGVGAVGMCFSGGFALGMAVDAALLAPVLSQPSLPLPLGKARARSVGVSDADLARVKDRVANENLCVLGLRFSEDRAVPDARWARYRAELGDNFIGVDIDSSTGNPNGIKKSAHSVLTEELVDEPGHPTKDALERVLVFLRERLAPGLVTMRFVVYGAGAIGGVVGARMFENGHDVVLIARGAHYEAIRDNGLRIQSPDDDATLAIPVVDHPAELNLTADDVVFLAMKSQDTLGACEALAACAPSDIAVACFQNGVENERVVLRHFAGTYAVCVMSPTAHIEPGLVLAQSAPVSGLLDIGRYPSGLDDRAQQIAGALNASTFHSIPRPDVMRWKYTKLLMNLANSIEAVVAPDPMVGDLVKLVRAEGEACLHAAGIDFASREEDKERRGDRMSVRPVNGEFRGGGSSWQSLARGTGTIETDYLNGEIVLLGRIHGVPTPANELMQHTANRLAGEGAPPKSIPVDSLLAQLD